MKKGLGIGALVAVAFVLAIATAGSRGGESEAVAAEATLDDEAASMGHASAAAQEASIPEDHLPRWTADGELKRPESWQEWVMVGASIGLNYSEEDFEPVPSDDGGPGSFHNIYMQPWSYRHFRETGELPEGTMFILSMFSPSKNADPARGGWYEEGPGFLAEIHLKQEDLHESGWGFYGYVMDSESASMIPGETACYSCHAQEAMYDHVFVQFYPALVDRLSSQEEMGARADH